MDWLLVTIGLIFGDASGVSSINGIRFNNPAVCQNTAERINKEIAEIALPVGKWGRHTVFCVYDPANSKSRKKDQ